MKCIKLKRIELTNFKGQSHRVETFGDGENFIIGPNGSGKSSVFDAFTWLLFGKDSKGQSEALAKVKMLDKDGEPVWHTDNKVEATFVVDGEELTLSRTYKEKWRKPKGQSESVYDGQTTVFSWNGNEKISANEYKKRVSELINEDLFKLITDPLYFATLKPEKRREIIMSLAGNVDDHIVIASHPELQGFEVVGDIDEMKKVALSTKNKLTKERDNYPARIDELNRIITDIKSNASELDELETIKSKNAALELQEQEEYQKLENVQTQVSELMKQNQERLQKLQEIDKYKSLRTREIEEQYRKEVNALESVRWKSKELQEQITRNTEKLKYNEYLLETKRDEIRNVQLQMKELDEQEPPTFDDVVCPTCQRPFENQAELKSELLEKWNNQQRLQFERLQQQGNMIFQMGKDIKLEIERIQNVIDITKKQLDALPLLQEPVIPIIDFTKDEELQKMYAALPEEISVSEAITNLQSDIRQKIEDIRAQKALLKIQIEPLYDLKYDLEKTVPQHEERVDQLLKEQLEVNQRIADQEKKLYLIELFNKQKIEMMNDKVASHFDYVTFKMFNYTLEGNPVPTCEIIVDGVDYTALNTASKMNAGLDIINALIKFYDVKAPIFIDNRESVTTIKAPDTQIINLKVEG